MLLLLVLFQSAYERFWMPHSPAFTKKL